MAVRPCSRSGAKSTSSFGSYASGWMPTSWVLYPPNRLMCSVRYGEMCAGSSGPISHPSSSSWRTISAMSRVLWKITAFLSRALNFIAFSCFTGSLSAMTPRLPKPTHWENRLNDSTLLVAAVTRRRNGASER